MERSVFRSRSSWTRERHETIWSAHNIGKRAPPDRLGYLSTASLCWSKNKRTGAIRPCDWPNCYFSHCHLDLSLEFDMTSSTPCSRKTGYRSLYIAKCPRYSGEVNWWCWWLVETKSSLRSSNCYECRRTGAARAVLKIGGERVIPHGFPGPPWRVPTDPLSNIKSANIHNVPSRNPNFLLLEFGF